MLADIVQMTEKFEHRAINLEVAVLSKSGYGSTFVFTLPALGAKYDSTYPFGGR